MTTSPPPDAGALMQPQLDAYLARIGYEDAIEPTLAALSSVVWHHIRAIPFENLNPFTGRAVPLDMPALVDKLVTRRRGGYCFEQNSLLRAALRAFGFDVTPLIARVMWNRAADSPLTAATHMLLRVDIPTGEGQEANGTAATSNGDRGVKRYFVDVGFGSVTQDAAISGDTDAIDKGQYLTGGAFRLVPLAPLDDAERVYSTLQYQTQTSAGAWVPVYVFNPAQHAEDADYIVANWFTSTHPDGLFTNGLVVSRPNGGRKASLFNNTITYSTLRGAGETKDADAGKSKTTVTLDSAAALEHHLLEDFGIDAVKNGFDIDAVWAKVEAASKKAKDQP